jgi:hypothetical protein
MELFDRQLKAQLGLGEDGMSSIDPEDARSDRFDFIFSGNKHLDWLNSSTESLSQIVGEAWNRAEDSLHAFATSPNFRTQMQVAFGNGFYVREASPLSASWLKGEFGNFPSFEIRDAAEINGANGAFAAATNTIYLSREFVSQNAGNLDAVTDVFLEEYGHYIDSRINGTDTGGDEGEIFQALVRGEGLSAAKLAAMKGEDDGAIAFLDGEEVAIEQAEFITQNNTLNFFAGGIKDWIKQDLLPAGFDGNFEKKLIDGQKEGNFDIPAATVDLGFLKFNREVKSSLDLSLFAKIGTFGETKFSYPLDLTLQLPQQLQHGETLEIVPEAKLVNASALFDATATKGFELPNAGFKFEFNAGTVKFSDLILDLPLLDPKRLSNRIGINSQFQKSEISLDVLTLLNSEANRGLRILGLDKLKVEKPKLEDGSIKPNPINSPGTGNLAFPDIAAKGRTNNFLNFALDVDKALLSLLPQYRAVQSAAKLSGIAINGLGLELNVPSAIEAEGNVDRAKEELKEAKEQFELAKKNYDSDDPRLQEQQQQLKNSEDLLKQAQEELKREKESADSQRVRFSVGGDFVRYYSQFRTRISARICLRSR